MSHYVLKPSVVENCLRRLVDASVHRLFPGYLCLHQQAGLHGRTTDLPFPYTEFFDAYFRVRDGDKPYFVPFKQTRDPDDSAFWFNSNVAGTYAPSSLRMNSPLLQVVNIEETGHNSRWGLTDDHWKLAKHHLAGGEPVPVESLAAFLLRDYALEVEEPSAYDLVAAFAEEFHYEMGSREFTTLYKTGDSNISTESFETV
jgi:hypothetical protein